MKVTVRQARKQLDEEADKLAACMCAAADVLMEANGYLRRKKYVPLKFTPEDLRSVALTLYIRRRDEHKTESWRGRGGQNPS